MPLLESLIYQMPEHLITAAKVLPLVGTTVAILATLASKTFPWLRGKWESHSVAKHLGMKLFDRSSIERSIRNYIPPFCQSIDPAGGEESRLIHSVRAKLFKTLDNVLNP